MVFLLVETIFLEPGRLLAILPENHYLANLDVVPLKELCREPFMLLEKGENLFTCCEKVY